MTPPRLLLRRAAGAALALLAACGGDETQANDDHTPVSYTMLVDDEPVTAPLVLNAGETVRVRLKFVNAAGEDLDEVETSHFAALSFDPGSLATVTGDANHHFQFDVTGGEPGTGTVTVSYGHDAQADEESFAPAAVSVIALAP
jgi:hypothetical protein